jgi:hypothetical protein
VSEVNVLFEKDVIELLKQFDNVWSKLERGVIDEFQKDGRHYLRLTMQVGALRILVGVLIDRDKEILEFLLVTDLKGKTVADRLFCLSLAPEWGAFLPLEEMYHEVRGGRREALEISRESLANCFSEWNDNAKEWVLRAAIHAHYDDEGQPDEYPLEFLRIPD